MLFRRVYCLKPTVLLLHHLVSPRSTAHSATWRHPLPRRRCAIGASPTTSNEPSANRRTRSPLLGSPCRSENNCAGGVMDCVLLWVRPQTTAPDWRPTARATAAATKRRMYAFFEARPTPPHLFNTTRRYSSSLRPNSAIHQKGREGSGGKAGIIHPHWFLFRLSLFANSNSIRKVF
jgi:hypothetical protein